MASRAISGKPGGGKSYYAVKLILDELISTDRHIVTNVELKEDGIAAWLEKQGRSDIDVYSRITRLDIPRTEEAQKMGEFWRYRGRAGLLPIISDADIKAGVRPDVAQFGKGVHYFLDEWHKFANARQWATTGPLLLWYISQHRHFGDDVTWITQHVGNVDKQWRSVTQDYTYCRNHAKEKFRGFTKDRNFHVETYLEPFTGNQTMQEGFTLKPDWAGIGSCYHTSISHGDADKGQKTKGLSVWWLYGGVVLVCVLVALFFIFGPKILGKKLAEKSRKEGAELETRLNLGGHVGKGGPVSRSGAPLDTPDLSTPSVKFIQTATVSLSNLTPGEAVSRVQPLPDGVRAYFAAASDSVILSGSDLQSLAASAEILRNLDRGRPAVLLVQAVVLRTVKGKSSSVGIWDALQDVIKAGGFGLGNLSYDPVSGVLSLGSVTAAQEIIRIMGTQQVVRSGFRVEARPVLAVESGKQAWFTSGQEVPVPVTTQGVSNSQTSINYKAVQFALGVTPFRLPDGTINLEISQSNGDIVGANLIAGNTVPTIATQFLATSLRLHEGEVAILGGIRVSNSQDKKSGVPLISEIPGLNLLFGGRDKKQEESEIVILFTVFQVPQGSNPQEIRRAEKVSSKEGKMPKMGERAGVSSKSSKKGKIKK